MNINNREQFIKTGKEFKNRLINKIRGLEL